MWTWPETATCKCGMVCAIHPESGCKVWHSKDAPEYWSSEERTFWGVTWEEPAALSADEMRALEIVVRLRQLDDMSVRPARAVSLSQETQDDLDKLAAIEIEASALRSELAVLRGVADPVYYQVTT